MTKKTPEQIREDARLRKQKQRARVRENGCSLTLTLNTDERDMLQESMRIRGGHHEYTQSEYLQLLIIRDNQRLHEQLKELGTCCKCGQTFNSNCENLFYGDSSCMMTKAQTLLSL